MDEKKFTISLELQNNVCEGFESSSLPNFHQGSHITPIGTYIKSLLYLKSLTNTMQPKYLISKHLQYVTLTQKPSTNGKKTHNRKLTLVSSNQNLGQT